MSTALVILLTITIIFAFIVTLYNVLKRDAFCNLATISKESLTNTLKCTGGRKSQHDAFLALSRHAILKNNCGVNYVDYHCWSDVIDRQQTSYLQKLKDLHFFANWCKH